MKKLLVIGLSLSVFLVSAQEKLTGTIIGKSAQDGYLIENAFDGNDSTYYSASTTTGGWVGLDLLTPHVISRVGFMPAASGTSLVYGLFEGANNPDFSDALPIYMVTTQPDSGVVSFADVSVSRGFRYVRFQGAYNTSSHVAEIEFYGSEGEGDDTQFYCPSNLPAVIVYVDGLKNPTNKKTELSSIISVISPDGKTLVQDSGGVRLRGHWSRNFPKKPYRLKFKTKTDLLGSPSKGKKWSLVPTYGDKTLMRTMLSFDTSKRMDIEYTPFCIPVNVWFNGDYKGCYQLCDNIDIRKGRIDIDEMDSLCISGEELTGGYVIEIDGYAKQELKWFTSPNGNLVRFKFPDSDEILDVQQDYITNHFNTMEDALYSRNFDIETGYHRYLDAKSFIKRHLCEEFIGNTDSYWSVFLIKRRNDDKFYTFPVWDFDLGFENDDRTYPINEKTDWVYKSGGSAAGDMKNFVDIFLSDSTVEHNMQAEWACMRETKAIDATAFLDLIDLYADSLREAQQMNFWRWPIMEETIHQNPVIWGSYEAEVENIRNYISGRIPWMDSKLLCEAASYELTISSAGWATLYLPFAASIPNGLTVYKVTGLDGDRLIREKVSLIEPNKAYLVKGLAGKYQIVGYRIPEWNLQRNGILSGTCEDMPAPIGSYVLQNIGGVVYFYRVSPDDVPIVPSNKAFLFYDDAAAPAPQRIALYEDNEISGLNVIETKSHTHDMMYIYRLSGELVYEGIYSEMAANALQATLPHGIYLLSINNKEYRTIVKH